MDQRKSFSDRVSRIADGAERPHRAPPPARWLEGGGLAYALSFPGTLLLGLLAGGFSRYAVFHVVNDGRGASSAFARPSVLAVGSGPQAYGEIILAMSGVFILGQVFRVRRTDLAGRLIAGAFLGLGLV
ncbi:MAG: hypothetical protein KDE00_08230 [Rhodobacteraceae bacterium]|nr:hypothetical protein [Paracoccaceae bacterium]